MTVPIVKRPMFELFLDGLPIGAHFHKEKAEAVKRKMEVELGFSGRVTVKVTEVFGELHPKGTRILMP